MSDPYEILGVARSATDEEIKSAYRKLAMEHHPDRNSGDPSAVEKFQKISVAYDAIKDASKRAEHQQKTQQNNFNFRTGPNGFNFGFGAGGPGHPFDTIFRDFMAQHQQPQNRSFTVQCQIGLTEAYNGCEVQFNFDGREIRVQLPRGVDNGSRIRVAGAGENSFPGIPPGDIFIMVQVQEHPLFKRDNRNIHTIYNLDSIDAILVTKIRFMTIYNDELEIEIPPYTKQNQVFNIAGYGMPQIGEGDDTRGHHVVTINLVTPDSLSSEQISLLQQVRNLHN